MKKTFIAPLLILLLVSLLLVIPATSQAQQLVVTVDGVNVNLDWSAMPAATSYTLYYALTDYMGDIDVDTIGSIEMGSTKSIYVPGLPSGLIIYVAILAHTALGDVVSNIEQFMGFAGTVTFPETGAVVMVVDDPGGIGNFTMSGTRDASGQIAAITQISGDNGSGPFILYITDDRPSLYKKGDMTVNFIYHADGSVGLQTVRDNSAIVNNSMAPLSVARNVNLLQTTNFDDDEAANEKAYAVSRGFPYDMYFLLTAFWVWTVRDCSYTVQKAVLRGEMCNFIVLLRLAYDGLIDEYHSASTSVIDFSCPIPAGAELRRYDHDTSYYLNGQMVGPQEIWVKDSNGDYYLTTQICYNAEGQTNGWNIVYRENGVMDYANHWKNGLLDGFDYRFYDNGSRHVITTYRNGTPIHEIIYNEDGTIKAECDAVGEGWWDGPCGALYW